MKKKILALILSLLYIVSAIPSFAADEAASSDDLGFFRAFNLVPEGVKGSDTLSRYQLAEIYYKLVTGVTEVYPADYASKYFSDINDELAAPVDFAYDMGLMNGTGGGYFTPNGNVGYQPLIKTMVSFLGYDIVAQSKGGYPAGYMTVAAQLDLDYDPPANKDVLTWADAEKIFVNASNADMAFYLNGDFSVQKGNTYLSDFRDIKYASGIVTADNFSDIHNDKSPYYGVIKINGTEFYVLESAKEIIKLGGQNVNIMYQIADGKKEVVYFQLLENETTVINGVDIANVTSNTITYYNGKKEEKIKYSSTATRIMYNGSPLSSYTSSDLNPFDTYDGSLTVVDNDSNGIADIIYVSAYKVMVAGDMKDGVIYSKFSTGQKIDLEGLNEGTLQNIVGIPLSVSDITQNDILTYEEDINQKVTKVTVTIDQGGGIIEGISKDSSGNIEKIVIADTEYVFSKSTRLNPDINKIRIGTNITLYFGIDANVADFYVNVPSDFSTGVITDLKKDSGLSSEIFVKIYSESGSFVTEALAEKIKLYHTDEVTMTTINADDLEGRLGSAPGGKVERQIIKYKKNADGKISEIVLVGGEGLFENDYFNADKKVSEASSWVNTTWKESLGTFGLRAFATSSSKIFQIPDEASRDTENYYAVKNESLFSGNQNYKLKAYSTEKNSPYIAYGIYVKNASTSTAFFTGNVFTIEEISEIINEEGMNTTKLTGYYHVEHSKGMKRTELTYADDCYVNSYAKADSGKTVDTAAKVEPAPGDVVGVTLNPAGKLSAVCLLLDYSAQDFVSVQYNASNDTVKYFSNPYMAASDVSDGNTTTSIMHGNARYWAVVEEKIGSYVKVRCATGIPGTAGYSEDTNTYFIPVDKFDAICDINERTGEAKCSAFDESKVYDSKTFGIEAASRVFIQMWGEYWYAGIVYNK